jgi:hypothetical protein
MYQIYFRELKNLINWSYVAIQEVDDVINNITKGNFGKNMSTVWHHINGLLIYTARISRILWGDRDKPDTLKRGEDIRKILNISDQSIFHHQNRKVRNDFDHIDERLDDIKSGKLNLGGADLNIGDPNTMIGNMKEGDYMRHYDPELKKIYFGENSLSIPELENEIKKLEEELNKVDNKAF